MDLAVDFGTLTLDCAGFLKCDAGFALDLRFFVDLFSGNKQ